MLLPHLYCLLLTEAEIIFSFPKQRCKCPPGEGPRDHSKIRLLHIEKPDRTLSTPWPQQLSGVAKVVSVLPASLISVNDP